MGNTPNLSLLLNELIEFQSDRGPQFGKLARDTAIGAGVSTLGTAGLLAGTGRALRGKAPQLGHMLTHAAKQHYKLFNPRYSLPMLRSLPEASGLFGKQLRAVSQGEKWAAGGKIPSPQEIGEAYKKIGGTPADIKSIGRFTERYGRSPSQTMESSVGLLSGSAATAVGAAGGLATSSGWDRKEKKLSILLDDLIEFKKKLYQPGEEDEPPAELPDFSEGTPVDYTVQQHQAKRAGFHRDIRIGTPESGLYSWATRKELPEAGGKIAIHPQPIHPHDYLGWEGDIPSGYGAGKVSTEALSKALVTKSTPEQTNISVRGSHRLAFIKTPRGHLLVREKHPEPPTATKPAYKSISPERATEHLKSLPAGTVVQPKIDGALVYVKDQKGKLEVFSHRKSKSGQPIIHTERFFKGRPYGDLEGKTILGELYGTRKGRAVEPQELGGILNAHIGRSLEKQEKQGVDLKIMPFDIQGKGNYPERLARLKELVNQTLPKEKFVLPEEARTAPEAIDLHRRIARGEHPLTREGIIIHPPEGKMIKVKHTEEANVPITGTFPGTGKFKGSHGGITYDAGRVGTGFSDETRRKLHDYIGRVARIRHQGQYPSGAYRAPSFIGIEENR